MTYHNFKNYLLYIYNMVYLFLIIKKMYLILIKKNVILSVNRKKTGKVKKT